MLNTKSSNILGGIAYILKSYLPFLFFSFLCLLFFSPDSYLYDLYNRCDTAWFFTCGKAWMNGMIPYIDFADSKGPLLWLIYGIGYLISPLDYIGVFWISVIAYSIIFIFVFRLAKLFLHSAKGAWAVVIMMSGAYFWGFFHYEVRAEDFCQPFIAAMMFYICEFLFLESNNKERQAYVACFNLGLTTGATLLIKFNITAMVGLCGLYLLYTIIKEKQNIYLSFMSFLAGFAVITLPFIIYMIFQGNLIPFFEEYFINTTKTLDSTNSLSYYIHEWLSLTFDAYFFILFAVCCIGAYLMAHKVTKYKSFFLLSFIFFFSIALHHCYFLHWHYFCICLFFPIWLCISLVDILKNNEKTLKFILSLIVIYTITSNLFQAGYLKRNLFLVNSEYRLHYYEDAFYMSQIEKPKIIYYMSMDNGQGTPVDCLPGTKYWATQEGATQEMIGSIKRSIEKRSADFIYINNRVFPLPDQDSMLVAAGYMLVNNYIEGSSTVHLYSKHNLRAISKPLNITNIDVLIKRNHFR